VSLLVASCQLILASSETSESDIELPKGVRCEFDVQFTWGETVGTVKSCNMSKTTAIDAPGMNFATYDAEIGALDFRGNKNIFYLPTNAAEKYPNLQVYAAGNCNIKEISKENFKDLNKLKFLSLSGNKIETIGEHTFEGLMDLESIYLRKANFICF
jgi:Leucine-rich repeat (LRR) protein